MINNSLSSQLEQINRTQENSIKLANAYLDALTTSKTNVVVELERIDGTFSKITIPSNIFLSNELARLTASFKNITGLSDNSSSTIVANDKTFRQLFVSSFVKAFRKPEASEMTFDSTIKISTNSQIESLLSPLTEVELTLADTYVRAKSAIVHKIDVSDGNMSLLVDGLSYGEVLQIITQNNFTFTSYEFTKDLSTKTSRFAGQFQVLESSVNSNNQLVLKLNTLAYSDDLNVALLSKQLSNGDMITSSGGDLLITIDTVDITNKTISCNFSAGVGSILAGDIVDFRSNDIAEAKIKIPVRMNEKSIIFIRPIDATTGYASERSQCKLFDSSNFIVIDGNATSTFNEYFASKVSDMGRYFDAMIRENSIPVSLGIKPIQPELEQINFNVVQINQHLTNTTNSKKLIKLQKEKDVVNSQLDVLTSAIYELNVKIAKGNYSTDAKKSSDITLRTAKLQEKLQKTALLSSIVADMTTAINNTAEQSIVPKYRARGFWKVQSDIVSGITNPQKIVQYQVRYRYVSNVGNTANATQMSYLDGDNVVNATFTPWTIVKTEPLERFIDDNGNVVWSSNSPTDADASNINQLDIPLTYGESAEIQVRALSEAGWPTSPMMSDWSKLVRIEFPVSLLQEADIASIARKNTEDRMNVKIQQEFANQGITEHISKSFREQEKYFAHESKDIASGRVTAEQKQISEYDYTASLEQRILLLEEQVNRRYAALTLQLLDENLRSYDVNNFSAIKLFAGYYTEDVDLTDSVNWGKIVTKTFYLKIINRNAQTVELLSIAPGILSQYVSNSQYVNVPLWITGSKEAKLQQSGQIFYNRFTDINGLEQLYLENDIPSLTTIASDDIDTSGQDALKNVVHLNGSNIETVKLISSAALDNYVAMTTSHPAYKDFLSTSSTTQLLTAFERMTGFNSLYRSEFVQTMPYNGFIPQFDDQDQFLVGRNSVGSTLITSIGSIQSYQVNGIDTSSAKEIYSGEQDSILVPITFQYRMTDALGNPNGVSTDSQNVNFEYAKKIGFDLIVSGKKFVFDVIVSAKFRPTSISNNSIGIQTVGSLNTSPNIQ